MTSPTNQYGCGYYNRDVINFLSCRRKNKNYRRINRLAKRVSHLAQQGGIYGRGTEGQGASKGPQKLWGKWCKILHSSHLMASNLLPRILNFLWTFLTNTRKIFKNVKKIHPRRALQTV